jgi:predicted DNA-binding protein (MmcQ/YjbR family)
MKTEGDFLKRLRKICLSLPEVKEVVTWGHPTFRAGKKDFAVYEEYKGRPCLAFQAGLAGQQALMGDPRFYRTPYTGHRGWMSLYVDQPLDWNEIRELVLRSYRLVALKRMLKAMDQAD